MSGGYEIVKAWRAKNKEKVNEQARRYRAKYPERNRIARKKHRMNNLERIRKVDAEQARRRRALDPESERRRKSAYLSKKLALQETIAQRPRPTCCELCGESCTPVFDHCHKTDKFRGWLCHRCNRVLGSVKDSRELLGKMAEYLNANV